MAAQAESDHTSVASPLTSVKPRSHAAGRAECIDS